MRTANCKKRIWFFGLGILLTTVAFADIGSTSPVYIEVSEKQAEGRGVARLRGSECLVITAQHVVVGASKQLRVVGQRGISADVEIDHEFERKIANGHERADVAVLRVKTNQDKICVSEERDTYLNQLGSQLVLRGPVGSIVLVEVSIDRYRDFRAIVRPKGEGILRPGMSGGLVVVNGRELGFVTHVCVDVKDANCERTNEGYVTKLDYLSEILGSWASPNYIDTATANERLVAIDKASEERSLGNMGQVQALESLVRRGVDMSGRDLSGVYLGGAHLIDAKLSNAKLRTTNLVGSLLQNANLSGSNLAFAEMQGAKLNNAILEDIAAPRASLPSADLSGANAKRSSWYGVDARGANFTGAKLQGANFQFADLRGATFDDSELEDAFFTGALLEGATFTGARTKNTDFTVAVVGEVNFTEQQKMGVCRTPMGSGNTVAQELNIFETIPDASISGGYRYEKLFTEYFPLMLGEHKSLPMCEKRVFKPTYYSPIWDHSEKDWLTKEISISLPQSLLAASGRRQAVLGSVKSFLKDYTAAINTKKFMEFTSKSQNASVFKEGPYKIAKSSQNSVLPFNEDSQLLIAIKYDPSMINQVDWKLAAEKRLSQEHVNSSGKNERHIQDPWGNFFLKSIYPEEIDNKLVSAFKEWTIHRSRELGNRFTIHFESPLSPFFKEAHGTFKQEIISDLSKKGAHYFIIDRSSLRLPMTKQNSGDIIFVLPRGIDKYEVGPTTANGPGHVEVDVRLIHYSEETGKIGSGRSHAVFNYVVPIEARFYERNTVRQKIDLATQIIGEALKVQLSGSILLGEDLLDGKRWASTFDKTGKYTTEKENESHDSGRWNINDDSLCFTPSVGEEKCGFLYRDSDGFMLVSIPRHGNPWVQLVNIMNPSNSKLTIRDYLFPGQAHARNSKLSILDVTLGMPMNLAMKKILSTDEYLKAEIIDLPGGMIYGETTAFSKGKVIKNGSSSQSKATPVTLITYPGNSSNTVDAIIRFVDFKGGARIQDLLIEKLITKFGEPTHRSAYRNNPRDVYLFWTDAPVDLDKIGTRSHGEYGSPCFPMGKYAYPYVPYSHSIRAPGFFDNRVQDTRKEGASEIRTV